ncbi:putative lipoprotein [Bacillus sp. B-jedd]|nr:putative lipoprotein [Bacillus sp. B-jedd]
MKYTKLLLLMLAILAIGIISACSSNSAKTDELKLDPKHAALPDYVLATPEKVQETYVMASEYPEVLASVPCYCSCGVGAGHKSNLDCFVKGIGDKNAITEWDDHGTA